MADLDGEVHGAGVEYKRKSVAYLLWLVFGPLGAYRFYLGHTATGVLYVCTCGLFLVGWVIDLFMIPSYVKAWNHRVDFRVGVTEERGFVGGAGV